MQPNAFNLCIFTLFAIVNAGIIPLRPVWIPSNVINGPPITGNNRLTQRTHPRLFGKRQQSYDTPSTVITLVAAASEAPVSTIHDYTISTPPSPTSATELIPTASSTISTMDISASISSSLEPPSFPTPSSPPPMDSGSPRKYVFAHHMVGNTYPYTLQDWADDISLAHASGLDAFALNMGTDDWQPAQVAKAYQAAQQSGLNFKLFLSLDMSSFPCASPDDARTLRNLVSAYILHPNQMQYDNRAFVSTFAGESCNFGQGSVTDGWRTQFVQHPDLAGKIYFVPSFFIDPATFKDYADIMDGDFNWNSGWPIQVTTSFAQQQLSSDTLNEKTGASLLGPVPGASASAFSSALESNINIASTIASTLSAMQLALSKFIGSTETDDEHLSGLAALDRELQGRDGESSKKVYMGAVSPWFFTHYGPDSYNKNFVFLSDQHLYSKRWESLVSNRDQFDLVEVLTWNDYGESHYIGPIKGAQPNSQAWTDGMNHTAWLELTQYYAAAFKTGQYPAIEKDKIFMWSRPHSTQSHSPDPIPQPTNFEIFEDAVWAVVMTTAPSSVVLSVSPTSSLSFQVPAGLSKLAIPISPGGTMKGVIQRGGETIVELNPTEFTFQGSPPTYNFNAFVASATAE